ncbi:Similar to Stk17b: Serine/threonine-protein kinase 17B (Rattus norvegicus) [Cotesia congregata]|uniref:Similar to Stk17b: Serine/threonine-protein kinase 17B (Rattus norvegicus) n=1 Tax=Cotesia congregata TaxID=51543 RepID=A0A8J2EBN7_COTCN|nr:Similar to Stk17b: Serine/threonine-protein kinase 17B (Rattus norvegicus) [Cotesia congregata]
MSSKKSPAQRKLSSKGDPKKLNGNCKGEKVERCRGRCRVQWSEKHVKEGLVLVQETQLARVVKTGPIAEHYEIDPKPFASGQWAKVYRCRSRSTGTLYAAKYSSRTRFNTDCSAELRHEIALLSLCSQSPRVVRLHDVYETPKEIILVMEYAPGGDLQTLIDGDLVPLEGDVVHFVKQLVEGLAYLHERNIAHLDIKPQNLVMMGSFPECDVKLCDFEISRVVLEGTEVREILGTPDYVAPEILHYEPITLAADMWSLGVTTYVLLTGFSPFGGETDQETFQNISLGEVDFPEELFEDVSTQAKDFVAKLLVLDPSARMSAKQCLRHDWLRAAPTQASPHLRRYLSKSREVLLERVVSRENLRRVALMNQQHPSTLTSSQASLSDHQGQLADGLSQSEMCLHMTTSVNLINSQCYNHPASGDSQTSLDSSLSLATSQTSLNSQASLATSQNYLLNAEQTLGLLNQVQSRSQANLNHANRRGLLSRMRSLNQIQSQACLTTRSPHQKEFTMNPLFGSRSQEKLYGLKCLSKSQGVLDIYHSLESIRKTTKKDNSKNTPKYLNSRFSSRALERCESAGNVLTSCDQNFEAKDENPRVISSETEPTNQESKEKKKLDESEENLDSLQSVESDTLTEDSDEIDQRIKQSVRQNSDISSHSNNSGNSDDKHFDEPSESENDEPKYTVAQLVSAFNKHQEVASKSSLEAIMTEKRVNEVNFPTGPKALRLFIPDINIQERGIVRRKTSYKPRKNWEELRKRNEKNEGLIKDLDNDSGNEDEDDLVSDRGKDAEGENKSGWTELFEEEIEERFERNVVINEKYKQCVNVANSNMLSKESEFIGDSSKEERKSFGREDMIKVSYKEDDGKSFDKGGIIKLVNKEEIIKPIHKEETSKSSNKEEIIKSSNKEDIITPIKKEEIIKSSNKKGINKSISKEEIIKSNNTEEIIKPINKEEINKFSNKEGIIKSSSKEEMIKSNNKEEIKINENKYQNSRLSYLKERMPNYIYPEVLVCPKDEEEKKKVKRDSSVNLKDILKMDGNKDAQKNIEKLRKRTSITKIIVTDEFNKSCDEDKTKLRLEKDKSEEKEKKIGEEKKIWGKVCTGSYTRAMEKFNGKKNIAENLKSKRKK